MFELNGKVAIVTGASSGLGADAARGYAEAGASVALIARREDRLIALAEELAAKGCDALAVRCDVSDEAQVIAAVEKVIAKYGKIDILLNNAGTNFLGSVDKVPFEEWQRVVGRNLNGPYLMSKHVIPHMLEKKYGKIVNIASINAMYGDSADWIARHTYNATKGGVHGLTIGMASTYAKYNITVNTVCPGLFETEMTTSLLEVKPYMDVFFQSNPMNRIGRPGELNGAVLFLSSDASSYVTGQYIMVTGGDEIV